MPTVAEGPPLDADAANELLQQEAAQAAARAEAERLATEQAAAQAEADRLLAEEAAARQLAEQEAAAAAATELAAAKAVEAAAQQELAEKQRAEAMATAAAAQAEADKAAAQALAKDTGDASAQAQTAQQESDAALAAQMNQQNLAFADDPRPKDQPIAKRTTKSISRGNLKKQKQAYESSAAGDPTPVPRHKPTFSAAPGSIKNMIKMFNDKASAAMSSTDERGNVRQHPFPKLRKTLFDGGRTPQHKAMYEQQAA